MKRSIRYGCLLAASAFVSLFYRAMQVGSPQYHWHFGDMLPVQNVGDKQAEEIIEFVRWFQQDAGLY